ncbi:hypothetical protein RBSH_01639 [Rhodopirellula baltica SH28]|uniref:Uncharacterized protein n=2 Tax=Rhodopirellula baltica TaxID=265606 RepID=K5EAU0_RHOBT|nr:hypothetical protein RBSH_01639 [Rhodopirellula baltica SH28]ELP30191.1 hypothetical protein RBSWK_05872 [Rhodopirellula baltica SWK14]
MVTAPSLRSPIANGYRPPSGHFYRRDVTDVPSIAVFAVPQASQRSSRATEIVRAILRLSGGMRVSSRQADSGLSD